MKLRSITRTHTIPYYITSNNVQQYTKIIPPSTTSSVGLVCFLYAFRASIRPERKRQLVAYRNIVDALGLAWFIVGNMWIFGDEKKGGCDDPSNSAVYNLCMALLIITYVNICLPCFVAVLMVPVLCLCSPCLVRLLARLQVVIVVVVIVVY